MAGQQRISVRLRAFGVLDSLLPKTEVHFTGDQVTVHQVLRAVCEGKSNLARALFNEQDELQVGVQVFLNGHNVRHLAGLRTPVPDGSEILVLRGDLVGGVRGRSDQDSSPIRE